MPHLSIIIPHRHNDPRFETTVLSVLENRPDDCEIIAVHDGSYRDPYKLSDELLFIEVDSGTTEVQQINAGLVASCAPIVCSLLDGVCVEGDWTREPLEHLERSQVHAVAVGTKVEGERRPSFGIDSKSIGDGGRLQRGKIDQTLSGSAPAGPSLQCGFFRKRTLLALGTWDERLDVHVADVELAWLMQHFELSCTAAESATVAVNQSIRRSLGNAASKQLAELSVGFGLTTSGAASAMSDLLRGCLSGSVSTAVSWATGIMGARSSHLVTARIDAARERLEKANEATTIHAFPESINVEPRIDSIRKAA